MRKAVLALCIAFLLPLAATATTAIIPAAASSTGVGGSRWVTTMALMNPRSTPVMLTLYVFPAAADNSNYQTNAKTLTIPGNSSMRIQDALGSLWGFSGLAAIRIDADAAFIVETRVINIGDPNNTYSLAISPAPTGVSAGQVGIAADVENDLSYRTNVGIFNNSASPAIVEVDIIDESGTQIGQTRWGMRPYSILQRPITELTSTAFAHATIRIVPPAGYSGQLYGYVSVVNNTSQDGSYALMQAYPR